MTRDELIAAVLANPEALWVIRTSKVRVAGPWLAVRPNQWERYSPEGYTLAHVGPSHPPSKPDFWEFQDYYDEDGNVNPADEQYESAVREYERQIQDYQPWTVTVRDVYGNRYAATFEEAMRLGDAWLQERGVLLVGGAAEVLASLT